MSVQQTATIASLGIPQRPPTWETLSPAIQQQLIRQLVRLIQQQLPVPQPQTGVSDEQPS
jgi:hypothetical protein